MNDPTNMATVPSKWKNTTIVYDEKYHWMVYRPNRDLNKPSPCADCSKIFYGDDGKIILKLHRILNHARDVVW